MVRVQRSIDMELHIVKDGYQEVSIQEKDQEVYIQVDERINATLLLTYSGEKSTGRVTLDVKPNGTLHILLKNETTSLKLALKAELLQDARLHLAYCDLQQGNADIQGEVHLCQQGAYADIRSACIVENHKHFEITCVHEMPHTVGMMEHYAIVKEQGDYRMEACGKIVKGAHDSASHQTTRVLTLSEQHHSQVVPLLLIDENDVKASHATTLGQPDENQLYYLQTRGLNRKQALGLLSIGYILPIADIFEDEEQKARLKNEIEMKVGLHA